VAFLRVGALLWCLSKLGLAPPPQPRLSLVQQERLQSLQERVAVPYDADSPTHQVGGASERWGCPLFLPLCLQGIGGRGGSSFRPAGAARGLASSHSHALAHHYREPVALIAPSLVSGAQAALRALWDSAFPGHGFPAGIKSERWKEMGWQSDDPGRDFRWGWDARLCWTSACVC
jgi:hypothetical protein